MRHLDTAVQISKIENILLNLAGGLPLSDLSGAEILALQAHYGPDWKQLLGYEG